VGGHHIKVAEFRIKPSDIPPPLTCDYLTILFVGKVAMGRGGTYSYPLLFIRGTHKVPHLLPCGTSHHILLLLSLSFSLIS
jgi:hypothetical protein